MMPKCPHCGTLKVERNGYCATYNFEQRKADRTKIKEKKPINKISPHRRALNVIYAQKKDKYLFDHPNCEYHGKDCKGGILHHMAGREGFIDLYAEEHDIPALVDDRYFMNLCQLIHDQATEHSAWAIEQGISVSRTSKKDL
jgi:hypothetical protein